MSYRRPGEAVAIREIWRGRVWAARPATVVRDDPDLTMLHVPPRALCQVPVDPRGRELRLPTDTWDLVEVARGDRWNLSFAFPNTPYAVILGFDEHSTLDTYYVNLQTPLARSPVGFDLVEHVLDVVIPADRSGWAWKDEDELAEAIARRLFTHEDAAGFRRWGERAAERVLQGAAPFDQDWSGWRPNPAWAEPTLPDGWDALPAQLPPPAR